MTDNLYQAYTDDTILNSNPLGLVVALYEGAIDSCVAAKACLVSRDIPGRTKAVSKIINILTELLRTLDDEKGGDVSRNLRPLYAYIIGRVTEGHVKQQSAPIDESQKLLATLLEGWKEASTKFSTSLSVDSGWPISQYRSAEESSKELGFVTAAGPYGGYSQEGANPHANSTYSF